MYSIETKKISNGPGYWSYTDATIKNINGEIVGGYVRNYHSYTENTFAPFEQNGQWYALYSKNYTCTRLMELPSCIDLGGEESNSTGFCPVEIWIPTYFVYTSGTNIYSHVYKNYVVEDHKSDRYIRTGPFFAKFGLISGCIWGDDTSWKLMYVDLQEVSQGRIIIDDRFGYLELPGNQSLKEAVDVEIDEKTGLAEHFTINEMHRYDGNGKTF